MLPFKSVETSVKWASLRCYEMKMRFWRRKGRRVPKNAQCGRDSAEIEAYYGEASAWLHRGACEDAWRAACDVDDLTIPAYVDRRPGARPAATESAPLCPNPNNSRAKSSVIAASYARVVIPAGFSLYGHCLPSSYNLASPCSRTRWK
jgi:hypothetical protein